MTKRSNPDFMDIDLSCIRRWPTAQAKAWVENYVKRSIKNPSILAVVAVGSAVREGVQSNDVDLLTIVKATSPNLQERPPLEVDLRTYVADNLEWQVRQGHDYLGWAVKFGVVLHEKNRFWSELVSSLRGQVPLPSARIARERAVRACEHARVLLEAGDNDAALEQVLSLLTHLARAELINSGVYPASRPELPKQLAVLDCSLLARLLSTALNRESTAGDLLRELKPEISRLTAASRQEV